MQKLKYVMCILLNLIHTIYICMPILLLYTGGIRCVKINAYLEQKLGFGNVSRLQGGIISYAREIEALKTSGYGGDNSGTSDSDGCNTAVDASERARSSSSSKTILPSDRFSADFEADIISPSPTSFTSSTTTRSLPTAPTLTNLTTQPTSTTTPPTTSSTTTSTTLPTATATTTSTRRNIPISKFRGQNYVFDERMNSAITNEILTSCETCGEKCDMFTNCGSYTCHVSTVGVV